ncbi:hypothetical protein HPY25_22370, partial [Methylobacterium sp. IIF4SW-B5]|nr:hypothetical protein [Methylobacterium ajmalii]
AWRGALAAVAGLFVAAALADLVLARGLWDDPAWFLGFDAALLAVAAGFALISHKVDRFRAPGRARRQAAVPAGTAEMERA